MNKFQFLEKFTWNILKNLNRQALGDTPPDLYASADWKAPPQDPYIQLLEYVRETNLIEHFSLIYLRSNQHLIPFWVPRVSDAHLRALRQGPHIMVATVASSSSS